MRAITVSQFKAHALGVLKGVAETGEKILVTKHGKPLAVVGPYRKPDFVRKEGRLEGTILDEKDLVAATEISVR